jgi:hypothetical protein
VAFDLAISNEGDLIVSAAHDLQGVSGAPLIEQQIKMRLKLVRGAWFFDRENTLGSTLHTIIGKNFDTVEGQVEAQVRQALLPMTNIVVSRIRAEYTMSGSVLITVAYRLRIEGNVDDTENEVSVSLSSAGGND